MVDRKSIRNDLNAIANAVSRNEDLSGIAEEIAIVLENMAELAQEELADADEKTQVKPHSKGNENSCPAS